MPNSAQNSMPNNSQSDMWEPMAPPASADFFANLRQIIGPYIGCATSVGAECNDDIVIWELGFKISLCQPRVIPLRYFPQKDPGKSLRREFELRSHSRNVVDRYICAQDSWKMQDRHASLCTVFFELRVIHRPVTRSE